MDEYWRAHCHAALIEHGALGAEEKPRTNQHERRSAPALARDALQPRPDRHLTGGDIDCPLGVR